MFYMQDALYMACICISRAAFQKATATSTASNPCPRVCRHAGVSPEPTIHVDPSRPPHPNQTYHRCN